MYIEELTTNLPNFGNVATTIVRHTWSSRIVIHDRIQTTLDVIHKRLEPWDACIPGYEEFNRTLRDVSNKCIQRVIFVEDLAPSLINYLGATFQIPPHVFEEHLDGSGYQSHGLGLGRAAAWDTRSWAQGYTSITWFRPVLPLLPITTRLRSRLIRNVKTSVRCIDAGCERRQEEDHSIDLRLSGTYGVSTSTCLLSQESITKCLQHSILWAGKREPRYGRVMLTDADLVSHDSRKIGNDRLLIDVVIVLLDPLPVPLVEGSTEATARRPQESVPLMAAFLPRPEVQLPRARMFKPQEVSSLRNVHD